MRTFGPRSTTVNGGCGGKQPSPLHPSPRGCLTQISKQKPRTSRGRHKKAREERQTQFPVDLTPLPRKQNGGCWKGRKNGSDAGIDVNLVTAVLAGNARQGTQPNVNFSSLQMFAQSRLLHKTRRERGGDFCLSCGTSCLS